MQWVFAPDVAQACVRAIEVPEAVGQAFNVAHAESTTQRTFVEALGRTAGIEPVFVSIPRTAILAAGGNAFVGKLYFGEYLDLPPLTGVIDQAARILDFTPTPLDTALRASFDWYTAQPRRPVDYTFEDQLLVSA
jgi:nucleoside-diphosphate-sugar epimerase